MINFKLLLKGIAIGGADVIPGVSGGTIALITGIYEELLNSLRSINYRAFDLLVKGKLKAFWNHVNGGFLVNIFSGVMIGIFTLAKIMPYFLETHPIVLSSFFFGLILVSAFYIFPKERKWETLFIALIGATIAYLITSLSPEKTPDQLWFVFISGAIAICALLLPGISGSFILILLTKYGFVLNAVKIFDVKIIVVFGLGCMVGLIFFSKFIYWLLSHFKVVTMACLAGFMIGSLNKIWPWTITNENSFTNISPISYKELTDQPNQLLLAIVFCLIGSVLVLVLERFGKVNNR